MKRIMLSCLGSVLLASSAGAQDAGSSPQPILPPADSIEQRAVGNDYAPVTGNDRVSYVVEKNRRGTSLAIDQNAVARFCGDVDGCSVRIGLHNWDDTGRVASREFLFFYNPRNGVWRASLGDLAGADSNNVTEHVNNSWSCYMTDGTYRNWADAGDGQRGFALLSWNQYNADCFLTIID